MERLKMKKFYVCIMVLLFVSVSTMVQAQQSAFQGTWIGERSEMVDRSAYRIVISGNSWTEFYNNRVEASGTARFSAGRAELLLADGRIARDLRLLAPGLIEQPISMWDGYYRFRQINNPSSESGNTQNNTPRLSPMNGWQFSSPSITLNNRNFNQNQYAESWREQEGVALVQGIRRNYWLYDSYSYHDGYAGIIFDRIIPAWIEKMGYVIDFDNIQIINPNTDLASSVKALMAQRGCDISVTLVTDIPPYHFVIINNYDKEKDVYSSELYPLYK